MAAIIFADVLAFAPELESLAPAAQVMILEHVNADLDVDQFDGEDGPTTKLARVYLAAHMGTLARPGRGAAAGPVASQSAGGLSKSYATMAGDYAAFSTTMFGRQYLELARCSFARLPVVI